MDGIHVVANGRQFEAVIRVDLPSFAVSVRVSFLLRVDPQFAPVGLTGMDRFPGCLVDCVA